MNKRKILYIVALLLSLMFICVVAFGQEPTKENVVTYEKSSKPKVEKENNDNDKQVITIHQEEVQDEILDYKNYYQEYQIPHNRGFKSYMSFRAITSKSSPQYILQNQYAYTGEFGIRQVDERFCIAIGTFSNARVGTYVDLILENETIIPCIVSDFKSVQHTDSSNKITSHNGCVSEFLIDISSLHTTAKRMGDISYCMEEWKSPVKIIKVYEKNIFDGE